ncbi:MAG TPA: hypothetical protein VK302_00100 [Terriglobales bacterium]|nr:hypothetical protein [Terriglobales bacterium]
MTKAAIKRKEPKVHLALTIAIATLLALVGCNSERKVTPEVKAAVVTILEHEPPNTSELQRIDPVYLAAAHLAIRTKQDALVVGDIERGIRLWGEAGTNGQDRQQSILQAHQGCQLLVNQTRKDAGLDALTANPCSW